MIDLDALIDERIALALDKRGIKPANDQGDYLTVADYARRWSVSPSTVRHAIRDRRLVVTRIGRAIRISADARISTAVTTNTERARLRLMRGGR